MNHDNIGKEGMQWVAGGDYCEVFSHQLVREVCLRPQDFSSNLVALVLQSAGQGATLMELPEGAPKPRDVLAIADPPVHTRQRKLLNAAFHGPRLLELRETIQAEVGHLAAQIEPGSPIDWMRAYASPLPLRVIVKMIGLPMADLVRLESWSSAGVAIVDGSASGDNFMDLAQRVLGFHGYLQEHFEGAEHAKSETLLRKLHGAVLAGEIDQEEAVSILLQLVVAGSESTASLLGAMVHRLCCNLGLQSELRENESQRDTFIEEVLRLDSPFQGHFRVTNHDTELAGVALKKGTRLMLHWAKANRDPAVYPHAEDISLSAHNPKRHLAFGHGIHRCLGAALARMEARVTLDFLLDDMPPFELVNESSLRINPSVFTRKLSALPIVFQGGATRAFLANTLECKQPVAI